MNAAHKAIQVSDRRFDGYEDFTNRRAVDQEAAMNKRIDSEVGHVFRSLDDIKRTLDRMETKIDGKADK